ncbi:DUF3301 domain-containing protein [Vibrio sp.]|nr:DUF3301 domain-containing protein [Vibrio sp.]
MMGELLAILGLSFLAFLFLQHRKQAELAKKAITKRCNELGLQLLSVALYRYRFKLPNGQWHLHAVYQFEFSAQGDDSYIGTVTLTGFRIGSFVIPPYRMQ